MLRSQNGALHLRDPSAKAKATIPPRRILRWSLAGLVLFVLVSIPVLFLAIPFSSSSLVTSSLNSRDADFILRSLCSNKYDPTANNDNDDNPLLPQPEHAMVDHLFDKDEMDNAYGTTTPWIDDGVWHHLPVKGVLYMFVSNEDLQKARSAIKSVQDRFNHKAGYPWVILSNQYLNRDFRRYLAKTTDDAPIFFGRVDRETWDYPEWIPASQAELALGMMANNKVTQGASPSFHFSARYHAGFYFHHPLLQNADYSWRVEPGSHYSCDMVDPFLQMKERNKTLGFVMTSQEENNTMTSLWPITSQFALQFPNHVRPSHETILPWLFDDVGSSSGFNYCHIWSNFHIVDLSFLRSEEYQTYFAFLDYSGGFFYERWSDGSVMTMAAAMFLKRQELHFFHEIGYEYRLGNHCPLSLTAYYPRCYCDVELNSDFNKDSCTISMLLHIDKDRISEMVQFTRNHLSSAGRTDSLLSRLYA
ncbi:nucleotide-diphospho-sugar transferase [Zychaea mexicana]|uniref:nucleotide-diphospho-sugar transferase n=1 Tax=Zychaea mexicana TaxID=64656 RepID=UPI0022FE4E5D|nr:nucleotide-diphospho-sugar transferase [Zychaea mexicana]KAI9492522.1 nucleotide-diphospho-sugar transferase [Zychaea mexicana]